MYEFCLEFQGEDHCRIDNQHFQLDFFSKFHKGGLLNQKISKFFFLKHIKMYLKHKKSNIQRILSALAH